MRLIDVDLISMEMEMEKHVAKSSAQKSLALDPKKQKEFKKKLKKINSKVTPGKEKTSGVVYLGHLPHGFYENQIKKYMSQFGKVKAVKVSRSNKTGKSKGYAFVEFQSDDVAKIVADTMNNYLVFERLIKCQYMSSSKLHPTTLGRKSGVFKPPKSHAIARDRHNNKKREIKQERTIKRLMKNHKKKSDLLKTLGIDLQMEGLEKVLETGKQILMEKEKEKAADKISEPVKVASLKTPLKEKAKTPKSGQKSKTPKVQTPATDRTPKATPTATTKTTPATSKELITPKHKVTPTPQKKTKKTPGPGISPKTTPPTSKELITPKHKVTPMPQKKKKNTPDPGISPKNSSMEILMEDSEEEEILFKTPPNTMRSSATPSLSASAKKKRAKAGKENTDIQTPVRDIKEPQSKKKKRNLKV
ncbi:MKI67 FHA domain-interacting nucleolar phosphoprotein-like [Ostrea edulis]|uniref:MKI67 FHA domain-interacting nucleolar phosphoprotein-like n=1 Tax=Ostrea edulis TaxID=37623 RepID=UPI0024AF47E6|nr:MKI67 FHA domain-interacting nucleolar phosphoprotein-like [Ostrea edulis]